MTKHPFRQAGELQSKPACNYIDTTKYESGFTQASGGCAENAYGNCHFVTAFSRSSPDKPVDVLLGTDLKEFNLGDHSVIISQITTIDSGALAPRRDELLAEMEKMRSSRKADMVLLMVTDVLLEGTDLLFLGDGEIIRQALDLRETEENHVFIPGLVSRKKQMVPALTALWG